MISSLGEAISRAIRDLFFARTWRARQRYRVFNLVLSMVALLTAIAIFLVAPDIAVYTGQAFTEYSTSRLRLLAMAAGSASVIMAGLTVMLGYLRDGQINPLSSQRPHDAYHDDVYLEPQRDRPEVEHVPRVAERAGDRLDRDIVLRLEFEAGAQDRKANLNLALGGLGAVIALAVLGVSVFSPPEASNPQTFWMIAAARGGFSVTASVFAFFFLSTYRRNLSESRYFHNELTNVQSRFAALRLHRELTLHKPDRGDLPLLAMLTELASTERNFILRKGETTTDLHQKDLDRQEHAVLLAALSTMVSQASAKPPATVKAAPARRKARPA